MVVQCRPIDDDRIFDAILEEVEDLEAVDAPSKNEPQTE